jgi:hypothetical protein
LGHAKSQIRVIVTTLTWAGRIGKSCDWECVQYFLIVICIIHNLFYGRNIP